MRWQGTPPGEGGLYRKAQGSQPHQCLRKSTPRRGDSKDRGPRLAQGWPGQQEHGVWCIWNGERKAKNSRTEDWRGKEGARACRVPGDTVGNAAFTLSEMGSHRRSLGWGVA